MASKWVPDRLAEIFGDSVWKKRHDDLGVTGGDSWYNFFSRALGKSGHLGDLMNEYWQQYGVVTVTAPGAPVIASITPSGTSVQVFWSLASNGGSVTTKIQYTTNNGTSWTDVSSGGTVSPSTISGLTLNTAYTFKLRAVNAIGNGPASNDVSTTTLNIPSAPTITSITVTDTVATLNYTAPSSDGGSAITKYQYSVNAGSTWADVSSGGTSSPATVSGLTAGTAYTFLLRAVNAIGNGTASAGVSATTLTVPSAPTALSATPTVTSVSISFTAGATGGSAITKYQYSINSGATWSDADAGTTSPVNISGLSASTAYSILLRAVNAVGAGAASTAVSTTTLTLPAAPTISSITNGNQKLTVNFTAGSAGSSAITNYQYSMDGGTTWISAGVTASPFTITGLANGSSYTVYLRAVSALGSGAASSPVTATPNWVLELTGTGSTDVTDLVNGYRYHIFTATTGSLSLAPARVGSGGTVEVLVVGGGGAGGAGGAAASGGGGGAGAYQLTTISLTSTQTVTVGAGGTAAAANTNPSSANDGADSSIGSLIVAAGGGSGGLGTSVGRNGRSTGGPSAGGGGSGASGSTQVAGGTGSNGGYAGATGWYNTALISAGGGGGGSSAAGSASNTATTAGTLVGGSGGAGSAPSWITTLAGLTSVPTSFCGGGGGGIGNTTGTAGSGTSGGGSGGKAVSGTAGAANTGGGGGGGGRLTSTGTAGVAGGSGIVIVRYQIQ